jgi:transposase
MSTAWRSPPPASAAPSLAWGCRSKKSLPASERNEGERALWRRWAREIAPERLVFVDECGTHNSMTRLRARAPKGERVCGRVPRNRGRNTTLLASMTSEGMGPCMAVVGSTTKAVFETYVERVLAPSLSPGSVVVLDNLGAHRGDRVRELVEARSCELLFLAPYSPDFSPIEEAFSKLKALLRKARARARGALLEAIGSARSAITAWDARGYFGHCGYPLDALPS